MSRLKKHSDFAAKNADWRGKGQADRESRIFYRHLVPVHNSHMTTDQITIRRVHPDDDAQLADLIKIVMTEIGAIGEGYSINDLEVQAMSQNYLGPEAGYLVLTNGSEVVGGGGFAHLIGAPDNVCELRKMYFLPQVRGLGKAQEMLNLIFDQAKAAGYTKMYLETIVGADKAIALYERNGFRKISCSQGNTGHSGCDTYYERGL